MTIDKIGASQPLTEIQTPQSTRTNKLSDKVMMKLSQNENPQKLKQKFYKLLKESPLDDRIPTAKNLAKIGYHEVTGQIYGLGRWFTDSDGNMVNIVEFKNENGEKFVSANYTAKDGSYHGIKYAPDGNAIEGTITQAPQNPGDPTERFEYEYDIQGEPFIKKHDLQYPYYSH